MQIGLTDSQTHGLIPEMKIALILADVEHTINIKWASHAAVCSWESMNSGNLWTPGKHFAILQWIRESSPHFTLGPLVLVFCNRIFSWRGLPISWKRQDQNGLGPYPNPQNGVDWNDVGCMHYECNEQPHNTCTENMCTYRNVHIMRILESYENVMG